MLTQDEIKFMEQLFVDYYIETGAISESVRRAGFQYIVQGKDISKSIGGELLKKYQSEINILIADRDKAHIADQTEVLKYLTAALRGEIDEDVILSVGGKAVKLDKKIPTRDRNAAAKMLGDKYGLFKQENDKLDTKIEIIITQAQESGDSHEDRESD